MQTGPRQGPALTPKGAPEHQPGRSETASAPRGQRGRERLLAFAIARELRAKSHQFERDWAMTTRYHETSIRTGVIDEKNRTVSLSFSSELPVDQGETLEILGHGPGEADLTRLNDGHPLLVNHLSSQHVGTIEKARIDPDRKGRALVRFSKSPLGEVTWQEVLDGIKKHVSVGYERVKELGRKTINGRVAVRYSWRPYEISLVSVPADPSVGIGRLKKGKNMNNEENEIENNEDGQSRSERRAGMGLQWRAKQFNATVDSIAQHFPAQRDYLKQMATEALLRGDEPEAFARTLLSILPNLRKNEISVVTGESMGMSQRELGGYSLGRAIQQFVKDGRLSGLEAEVHRAYEQRTHQSAEGFWVPTDVRMPAWPDLAGPGRRDMTVGTFGQGGAFVQTNVLTSVIEVLRNRMTINRLGAQTMTGLQGNVAIPRQTAAASATSLPEVGQLATSNQAIDQVVLSPHRVGAVGQYSKQLLLQSSVDLENFIRDDLMKVLAIKHDALTLTGSGSQSEPTGILNTNGIGSVTFGAPTTFSKVIDFEAALAVANADQGRMAYLTTPKVKTVWKRTAKIGTTFPVFIWESGEWGDGTNDGEVNSYRAACTNQVPNDLVIFGDFTSIIQSFWGGLDVVIDPYSLAKQAEVVITINSFFDVALRHAASFCVSADSGAQ